MSRKLRKTYRELTCVYEFHQARAGGMKYEAALEEAVRKTKAWDPKVRVSVTAVKRALSKWQPENAKLVCEIAIADSEKVRGSGEQYFRLTGRKLTRIEPNYQISMRPRAKYSWGGGSNLD